MSLRRRWESIVYLFGDRARSGKTVDTGDNTSTWLKLAVLFGAVVLLAGLGWICVYRAAFSTDHRSDFTMYRLAGKAVLEGTDLYEVHNVRGWPYMYPPVFAVLMVPFAMIPVPWAALAWYALLVALAGWSVAMCVAMARRNCTADVNAFWTYTVPAVLVAPWFVQAAAEGQATVLLLWLVVAALYWQMQGRPLCGAACLAGAVLLKVFPVVLLAYFAWRRQWQFLVASMAGLFVGGIVLPALVFGWHQSAGYWREWAATVAAPTLNSNENQEHNHLYKTVLSPYKLRSQTLYAVCWRLTGDRSARAIAAGLALAMAAVTGVVGRRSSARSELLIISAILVWMLLAVPVSEFHYFLLLLLPMTVLTFRALDLRDRWGLVMARTTLIIFGVAGIITLGQTTMQRYGLLCWALVGLWIVLLKLACGRGEDIRTEATRHTKGF